MSRKDPQSTLFNLDDFEPWREHWVGMPEFKQETLSAWRSILVHFNGPNNMAKFAELVGQKITLRTKYLWYPESEEYSYSNKRWTDEP